MLGIIVRNTLVTYDRENSKIGFWKTNCSELWERLHIPDSPESPPLYGKNLSTGMPPTLAPNEAPDYVLPGLYATHFRFCSFRSIEFIVMLEKSMFRYFITSMVYPGAQRISKLDKLYSRCGSTLATTI